VGLTLLPEGIHLPEDLRTQVDVDAEMVHTCTRHVFEGRFTPLKLVVNGRKGRRVVVVLGSDRKHYRVLDLDFRKGGARILEEREEGEGDSDEVDDGEDEDVEMSGLD
jgi:anaphase-promoting complex subunit 4